MNFTTKLVITLTLLTLVSYTLAFYLAPSTYDKCTPPTGRSAVMRSVLGQ